MPKGKKSEVQTSFRKVKRDPQKRMTKEQTRAWIPVPRKPKPLSPLAQYIEDNLCGSLSVLELIEQFQEYDCEHPGSRQHLLLSHRHYTVIRCDDCGRTERRENKNA